MDDPPGKSICVDESPEGVHFLCLLPPTSPMCGCSKGGCAGCKLFGAVVALLLTLTTIAALVGVWVTHFTESGMLFGSLNGSVALITLIISLMACIKVAKKMCPCAKGACGGGSCGGCPCGKAGCDCKSGMDCGKCPACKHMPCTCK